MILNIIYLYKGGGGGEGVSKKFFSALWASVWSKTKGGGGRQVPQDLPLDLPLLMWLKAML